MFGIRSAVVSIGAAALCLTAGAQLKFSEIFINPPGNDNGFEYIELVSDAPNFQMTGYWVVIIEGDGTVAGVVDQALDLSAFSTGSNGMFLWRDAETVLCPSPESGTSLHVADFVPDIENGTNTYLIARNFTGSVGMDLDTNNDGVLDLLPWDEVIDAVAWNENEAGERMYAAQLGGFEFPTGFNWTPDVALRVCGEWVLSDTLGTGPGPWRLDDVRRFPAEALWSGYKVTPGSYNPTILGDVNGDGVVDDTDLALVLESFGSDNACLTADINGDGVVDDTDLAIVLEAFGLSCGE